MLLYRVVLTLMLVAMATAQFNKPRIGAKLPKDTLENDGNLIHKRPPDSFFTQAPTTEENPEIRPVPPGGWGNPGDCYQDCLKTGEKWEKCAARCGRGEDGK